MTSTVSSRLRRELKTLTIMIRRYCNHHHEHDDGVSGLCPECETLQYYALQRIEKCPFLKQEKPEDNQVALQHEPSQNNKTCFEVEKPPCDQCPVHCYRPEMREQIRQVMRWTGPRMLWRHPWLTLFHLWNGRRYKGQ